MSLKQEITSFMIENAKQFNRLNFFVNHFKDKIYDKNGNFLETGELVCDFIEQQEKRMTEIEHNIDYSSLYNQV